MKTALRRDCRRLRRQHAAALQQALDRSLEAWLCPLRHDPTDRAIGLYWPQGAEADLRRGLRSLGRPLALPAVQGQALLYRHWSEGAELSPDDCGIAAPPAALPALQAHQLALLLVPALAMDRQGVRLGSGGGWYDRLRSDPDWRALPALTVLPAACVLDQLPADPWDVPFDGWIDERGCHWIGAPLI